MEFDLIENDYDDFLNEILNNVNTQDKNLVPEKIQNALEEIGYDFKMYDGMYRICIRDSKCVIYLTKENDMVLVNKRLCKFQYIDQKIFAREKKFLYNLYNRNLNISPITYFELSKDENVIKMEKCEITLYEFIRNGNTLETNKIIDTLHKIFELHRIGFIHRDLHPKNLMLKSNDWYLIDYNVAHCPTSSDAVSLMQSVGWKEYTDPVVYKEGLHKASIKTEIYSIGKLINFILTGSPQNNKHFLSEISKKCTHKNQNERYNSVYEIIRDINLKN